MATLELIGLTKRFGNFTAVDNMNLKAADGEMIALLGGSGCGKTTTLRMIAGFAEPTEGSILVDGEDVAKIPPYKRNIGIFFQNYALFPHMTVFENVAFGLKLQKLKKPEIAQRVAEILALVKLTGLDKRYPRELSGGQQQRVALARMLAAKPGITGMWQVSGRSKITDFEKVVELDKKYIREWSMGLDLRILLQTVLVVLRREGSM